MIEEIRQFASTKNFRLSQHAAEELTEENISIDELIEALMSGEIIENYPEHRRGHC